MNKPLTPWYPPEVKPVRIGLYEGLIFGKIERPKWNGKKWVFVPPNAAPVKFHALWIQIWKGESFKWRGLSRDPSIALNEREAFDIWWERYDDPTGGWVPSGRGAAYDAWIYRARHQNATPRGERGKNAT